MYKFNKFINSYLVFLVRTSLISVPIRLDSWKHIAHLLYRENTSIVVFSSLKVPLQALFFFFLCLEYIRLRVKTFNLIVFTILLSMDLFNFSQYIQFLGLKETPSQVSLLIWSHDLFINIMFLLYQKQNLSYFRA